MSRQLTGNVHPGFHWLIFRPALFILGLFVPKARRAPPARQVSPAQRVRRGRSALEGLRGLFPRQEFFYSLVRRPKGLREFRMPANGRRRWTQQL